MNGQNDIYWNEATWQEINAAVLAEINKVRVAQKVFATTVFDDNPLQIAVVLACFLKIVWSSTCSFLI